MCVCVYTYDFYKHTFFFQDFLYYGKTVKLPSTFLNVEIFRSMSNK